MRNPASAIIAVLTAFLVAPSAVLDADTIELRPSQIEDLEKQGELTSFYSDTVQVDLAPSTTMAMQISEEMSELQPDIGIEVLFHQRIEDVPETDLQVLDRHIYNVLRSFHTMEGIPYYSASRGGMKTFFYESYVVEGPDSLVAIPDPHVDVIPPVDELTVFQRDSSFGKNTLSVRYTTTGGQVLVSMVNLTTMAYRGLLPVVRPGGLRMFLYVVREGRDIYFYGNCGVATYSLLGMRERVQDSFANRIRALHGWFGQQMNELSVVRD